MLETAAANRSDHHQRLDAISEPETTWIFDQTKEPFQPDVTHPTRRGTDRTRDVFHTRADRTHARRCEQIEVAQNPALLAPHSHSDEHDLRRERAHVFYDRPSRSLIILGEKSISAAQLQVRNTSQNCSRTRGDYGFATPKIVHAPTFVCGFLQQRPDPVNERHTLFARRGDSEESAEPNDRHTVDVDVRARQSVEITKREFIQPDVEAVHILRRDDALALRIDVRLHDREEITDCGRRNFRIQQIVRRELRDAEFGSIEWMKQSVDRTALERDPFAAGARVRYT